MGRCCSAIAFFGSKLTRMADSVLQDLTSSNLFDLTGVVAVVTGGGTVSLMSNSDIHSGHYSRPILRELG